MAECIDYRCDYWRMELIRRRAMLNRDYRDVIGGGLLGATGAAVAVYSVSNYSIGTITRMGPGMVPASLGALLGVFGLIIAATAMKREGYWPEYRMVAPLIILASVGVFGIMIGPFGMMPAIFVSTIVASLAELKVRLLATLVLAAALCLIAYLIFSLGLGLPFPLFAWPF